MRSLFHRPIRAARHLCARKQTVAPVELLEGRTLFSAPPVIDVMVLYTPAALADAGSIGVLDNRIHRAVADTNLALSNSQVNAGIRLVHEGEVSYSESGIINTDLDNLQSGSGALSGVQSLRSQYGADLVSLWVGRGDEGGRAFQPGDPSTPWPTYGFNVVQERYAADNYVFAHEIGHNLGAGHDRSDPMPRAIPIAYGKTFSAGSYTIGDIMSDVERIPYYSNPNVSFRGIPTGNPDNSSQPADNARVMNEFAPLLASYEPSKVPDTTFPVAAIQAVVVSHAAQSLNVKVEYAADLPVSVGGLGTGDIVVTGPSGFHQVAWFQGVDFTTDGMQRVASYQVSIAGYSIDPNAYSFTLQPNRVRDIYGNANPGGTLGAAGSLWANRAGPRLGTAYDNGVIDGTTCRFNNWIGADDPTAFYRFTLTAPAQFTANLGGLTGSVDELLVQDRSGDGQIQSSEILSYAHRAGTSPETIAAVLAPGTYDLWVAPQNAGIASSYMLTMSAATVTPAPSSGPVDSPVPPAPTPPPLVDAAGSITGVIYNDANADGARDGGESGIRYWQVYADLNNNGRLDSGEPSAWTNATGNYRLANLPAGFYIVRAVPYTGWRQVFPTNHWGQHVNLSAGQNVTGIDTAESHQVAISGNVFNDSNADGIRSTGEAGLEGFRLFIDSNNDGIWQSSEPSTLTNGWGDWSFNDLTPGTYAVGIISQQNWKLTAPPAQRLHITLASGGSVAGLLFGEKLI
jgi:hypothetical protein